jgi:hypothetical protein
MSVGIDLWYNLANISVEEWVTLVASTFGFLVHYIVAYQVQLKRLVAADKGLNGAVNLVYQEKTVVACFFIAVSGLFLLLAERAMHIPPAVRRDTTQAVNSALWSLVMVEVLVMLIGVYMLWITERIERAAVKEDAQRHKKSYAEGQAQATAEAEETAADLLEGAEETSRIRDEGRDEGRDGVRDAARDEAHDLAQAAEQSKREDSTNVV